MTILNNLMSYIENKEYFALFIILSINFIIIFSFIVYLWFMKEIFWKLLTPGWELFELSIILFFSILFFKIKFGNEKFKYVFH